MTTVRDRRRGQLLSGTPHAPDGVIVLPGGPAASGGLQVGDVVDKVQDTPVGSVDELILALRQSKVGDRVTVEYLRDGQRQSTELVLADKAAD